MRRIYIVAFLLTTASAAWAQPWTYDFGTGTGIHTTGVSTVFLPAAPSGTARVRVGTGAGSFNLENPGLATLGANTELRSVGPTGTSVNKFSVHDYTAGKVFYNKFSIVLGDNTGGNSATSGTWHFFQGDGVSFSDNNPFTGTQVFTGIQWVFGAGGTITTNYRNGSAWQLINTPAPLPLTQANVYLIEIYGNNSTIPETYDRGGIQNLAVNTWDFWVNGVLVGNDLAKALQADDTNIDSWMFYGISSTGNAANIFLDDFEYSNALPVGTPNTITTGTVTGSPFTLANCGSTAPGSIDFTSTGVFSAGNVYTAQLSDPAGSFASPVNIGTLTSTANSGTINFTIPAGSLSSAVYKIRIVSNAPITTSDLSSDVEIIQNGTCGTVATDYFRSSATGNWNAIATWESSPDNAIWQPATLVPDSNANTISIRNSNIVTISTMPTITADQLIIENGGILNNQVTIADSFIINNGPGDDMIIMAGGIYRVSSVLDFVEHEEVNSGGTVRIQTGGTIQINSTAGSAHNSFATTATTYIWEDASIFDWNTTSTPGATGVTFFPDAIATVKPIWRFSASPLGNLGGLGPLTVNGVLDANSNVIFTSLSDKTFRGITGTGNVTQIIGGAGKIIITDPTAVLGGSGVISTVNQVDIDNNSYVTMLSAKSVIGNIQLLSNSFVELGAFNLTVTGTVNGGSLTSHIITNGSGKLVITGIAGPTPVIFPIGATQGTITPLAIFNGEGFDYGARVEIGINPPIGDPQFALNRTWVIQPSGTPAGPVNVNFFYSAGEGNASFNYNGPQELGLYTTVWNIIQTGLPVFGTYQVPTTISNFGADTDAPLVLGNLNSILPSNSGSVAVNYFEGSKQGNKHYLNWKVSCISTPRVTISLERSADARNFSGIYSITADETRCAQPFDHTDDQPLPGINYYRLKMTDIDGKISYSSIVALLNAIKGFEIVGIAPNPVTNGQFKLNITTATPAQLELVISDIQGRIVQRRSINMAAGFSAIQMDVTSLARGTYQLNCFNEGIRSRTLRFVIQ